MSERKERWVIDGDSAKVLETFNPEETESVLARYKDKDYYDEVEVDHDGDIICWED